jgi:hypothetical protein
MIPLSESPRNGQPELAVGERRLPRWACLNLTNVVEFDEG